MLSLNAEEAGKMLQGNPSLRYRRRLKTGMLILACVLMFLLYSFGSTIGDPLSALPRTHFSSIMDVPSYNSPTTVIRHRNATWDRRADQVKQAFRSAYSQYQKYAFPADELRPLSNQSVNNFNGWGVTAIDSIDTMILMNLTSEYEQVRLHVSTIDFSRPTPGTIPFFETVIRYVGGLASAYHLTGDQLFLTAADDAAREMLPAFETIGGLPAYGVYQRRPETNGWNPNNLFLAEIGSFQLEFKYLAHVTQRVSYFRNAERVIQHLKQNQKYGLWPTQFDRITGTPTNTQFTVAALADSTYEYLLKGYLLSGRTEKHLLQMYLEAMRAAISRLVYISEKRNLMYITDVIDGRPQHNMQHLSCFFPGLLALGNYLLPEFAYQPGEKEVFQFVAEGLAETCWILYADQATGLGPEEVRFNPYGGETDYEAGRWINHLKSWDVSGRKTPWPPGVGPAQPSPGPPETNKKDYGYTNGAWYLRPEVIEAMFLLWKTTGDTIWRERAWKMFQAIERSAKVPGGAYATRLHVNEESGQHTDEQQSFFFAETLKYLFLTFVEDDPWPLDKMVFSTEAHPLPLFNWSESERSLFGIM